MLITNPNVQFGYWVGKAVTDPIAKVPRLLFDFNIGNAPHSDFGLQHLVDYGPLESTPNIVFPGSKGALAQKLFEQMRSDPASIERHADATYGLVTAASVWLDDNVLNPELCMWNFTTGEAIPSTRENNFIYYGQNTPRLDLSNQFLKTGKGRFPNLYCTNGNQGGMTAIALPNGPRQFTNNQFADGVIGLLATVRGQERRSTIPMGAIMSLAARGVANLKKLPDTRLALTDIPTAVALAVCDWQNSADNAFKQG